MAGTPTHRLTPLQVLQRFALNNDTLDSFIASRRALHPNREALAFEGRSWTWLELEDLVAHLAGRLRSAGVGRGDRVLVAGQNSPWHLGILLAAARLGAIFVPTNPQFQVAEARYVVEHCEPVCVLADEHAMPVMQQVLQALATPARPRAMPLDESLVAGDMRVPAGDTDPDAACIIVYTSGTTGFPKGAMHSQRSFIRAGEAFIERLHLQPEDRLMVILPMFHINAMFYSVAGSLAAGATLLVEGRFSASGFWRRVVELQATQVNLIEAAVAILLSRPADEFIPRHPLRCIYGVRQAMMARVAQRFNVPVLIGGYAMTEIPGVLSTPVTGDVPPGAMGRLCRHPDPHRPWAECRIVDDAGQDVCVGEAGELLVRTPVLMLGYFRDEAQTRQSLCDGWFRTGDLVRADAAGYYYFVSRKKDIIRRRGENIAGAELDRVIAEHPAVLVAAAIGVPSTFGDEEVLVAVKPKPGAALSEQDVIDWCRARLAAMKVPRYVVLLQDMPFTPTHKVAKAELRGQAGLRERAVDFG